MRYHIAVSLQASALGVFLALRLLIPPAVCAPTEPVEGTDRKLEEAEARASGLMKDLTPMLDDLDTARILWNRGSASDEALAARCALRARYDEKMAELYRTMEQSDELRAAYNSQVALRSLGGILTGKMSDRTMAGANKAFQHAQFVRDVSVFRTHAAEIVRGEEEAYTAAVVGRRTRRMWTTLSLALAAVLATVVVLIFRQRRRQEDWIAVTADPARMPAAAGVPGSGAVSLPSPEVLGGNYRPGRELGRGGMGVVFEAEDIALKRKVAIKVMRDELSREPAELEMFLREAQLVASLKHPNILEIYSILREGGRVYLVFEHVAGQTLSQALARNRRLPLKACKWILRQAAAALDYAHGRKVIHRDLKPSNIMVRSDQLVKVMDFGIAHQAKRTVAKLTRTLAVGTPPYMAPEQELGTVSSLSDLYALGACFYEMTTGRMPFSGPNFLEQKRGMLFVPPTRLVPELPPDADAFVRKALSPDPAVRFQSASEFRAALERLPESRPA